MEITREKLIAIWGLIGRLAQEKTSVRFHYLLLKNKRLIEPEVKSLQEAQQPPEGFQEFENKRLACCNEFCQKDENNEPKLDNGNFLIPDESKEEFECKLEEIKKEHQEVIDTMENRQKEFLSLLKEDVEIDFAPIPLSIMPEAILGGDVDLLFDLIEEDK